MSDLEELLARIEHALREPDAIAKIKSEIDEARARLEGASAPVLPPLDRPPTLPEVARFVSDVIVRAHPRAGRLVIAPLVPVVGLPGCGKTSFLTALGYILVEQRSRYHFPYEGEFLLEPLALAELVREAGGEPAHAEVLAPFVLDLGWDFARRRTDAFLRHASFPPRTPVSRGARFLVAQVRKDGAPYARLVSADVPGEDLVPLFRTARTPDPLGTFRALEDEPSATGVAARSLDLATGIVLLVDSTRPSDQRAQAHQGFFELLARALRPRARDALRALAVALEEEELKGERRTLEGVVRRLARSHARYGEELCLELEGPLLQALALALEPDESVALERADLRRFLRDLAAVPDERALVQAIGPKLSRGLQRPEAGRSAPELPAFDVWMRAAARLRGVPLGVARRFATLDDAPSEPELFRALRGLSIVETKCDLGRPLSPFLLPECAPWLEEVRAALRLAGGDVRTYESTVTGYAGLLGAGYAPGPFSTQTPVHVLEPVFDLLGVPRDVDG